MPQPQQRVYLLPAIFSTPGIIHGDIGARCFNGQRKLSRLAMPEFVRGPAPLPGQSLDARRTGRVNIDDFTANLIPTGFQHDCRVQNDKRDNWMRLRPGDLSANALFDPREDEQFKNGALDGTAEDDGAQLLAIDLTVFIEHTVLPALGDASANVRLFERFVPEGVSFNDGATVAGKSGRDEALAAADAADETDEGFAQWLCLAN
jgi:hypothetical protein